MTAGAARRVNLNNDHRCGATVTASAELIRGAEVEVDLMLRAPAGLTFIYLFILFLSWRGGGGRTSCYVHPQVPSFLFIYCFLFLIHSFIRYYHHIDLRRPHRAKRAGVGCAVTPRLHQAPPDAQGVGDGGGAHTRFFIYSLMYCTRIHHYYYSSSRVHR